MILQCILKTRVVKKRSLIELNLIFSLNDCSLVGKGVDSSWPGYLLGVFALLSRLGGLFVPPPPPFAGPLVGAGGAGGELAESRGFSSFRGTEQKTPALEANPEIDSRATKSQCRGEVLTGPTAFFARDPGGCDRKRQRPLQALISIELP